ncbi:MAG: twin-arginine translocase subunit TatC [Candidatus Woesearchaeota archaeon]
MRRWFIALVLFFIGFFTFYFYILSAILPYLQHLFPAVTFVTLTPLEAINGYLYLCFLLATLTVAPFILVFIYHYVKDALYKKEKHVIYFVMSRSLLILGLFLLGFLFSVFVNIYYIIPFSLRMNIFIGVQAYWSAISVLTYMITLGIYAGLLFQVPIFVYYMLHLNLISYRVIGACRQVFLLGSLFVGALLTPPDVISQILFALPLVILFEVGVVSYRIRMYVNKKAYK